MSKYDDAISRYRALEYESWNRFLVANWQQRYILLGLNIAAQGTLLSIGITSTNSFSSFLLLASLVSSVLGLVWVAETNWAIRIMDILKKQCIDKIRKRVNNPELFQTDDEVRKIGTGEGWLEHIMSGQSPNASVGIFIFFLPSIMSLVVAFASLVRFGAWDILTIILIFIDVLLCGYLIYAGISFIKQWKNVQ